MKDIQPKEYWVNVYKNELGVFYPSKDLAIKYASTYRKILYRIHVRIKNAETRGIGSGKARV